MVLKTLTLYNPTLGLFRILIRGPMLIIFLKQATQPEEALSVIHICKQLNWNGGMVLQALFD